MKKLIAICCGVLCMHNISRGNTDFARSSGNTNAEKTLIKALVSIVNPQSKKKNPPKKSPLSPNESPRR
jgi:hypothetical protein